MRATARNELPRARLEAYHEAPREADLIAAWGAGHWRGRTLRATDGAAYTVVYEGRPGGPAGPDFRDAVLRREPDASGGASAGASARVTGDIELHLTPAGWRAHGHATDPRYNNVALHVTLRAGGASDREGTPLASGRRAPLAVLAALSDQTPGAREPALAGVAPAWPCAPLAGEDTAGGRAITAAALREAGWARLRERAAALAVARARAALTPPGGRCDAGDRTLFIAIAEALGYGRDRDALRRCGERLAAGASPAALLAETGRLPVVERRRAGGLLALLARWRASGPLVPLRAALAAGDARAGPRGACLALVEALTVARERRPQSGWDVRERGEVSPGRARIVAINVALPYLLLDARDTASATSAGGEARWALTAATVEAFPGLPSNQITRLMAAQLGLARAPAGALAQQGLHHLWERHCREKRCSACPCALRPAPVWAAQ